MPVANRILDPEPVPSLAAYLQNGGGKGLAAARALGAPATIDEVTAAGIRGRGGAGFPTGVKWRTVAANARRSSASTVVVNAAEGEPGSFKDRELLDRNPYRVLEGALIAALAVGADQVIVGMKRTATRHIARVRAAIAEVQASDLATGVRARGRRRPARVPPRRGDRAARGDRRSLPVPANRAAVPARRRRDGRDRRAISRRSPGCRPTSRWPAPAPTPKRRPPSSTTSRRWRTSTVALAEGADWFREVGTDESPGTVRVHGERMRRRTPASASSRWERRSARSSRPLGGGARPGRTIRAVLQGAAAAIITADQLDTPASWEGMQAIGSGLGAAAFIVLDDATDITAVAASVSRFLAVESCGQCTPCKQDSLLITDALTRIAASEGSRRGPRRRSAAGSTRSRSARAARWRRRSKCVIGSILEAFGTELEARVEHTAHRGEPLAIVPMLDLRDGVAVLDEEHARKQPDWTYDDHWSGKAPADRLDDHRSHHEEL